MSWLGRALRGAARTAESTSIWDTPGKSVPLEKMIFPFHEAKEIDKYVVTTDRVVGGDTVAALSLKRYTSFASGCFEGIVRFEPDEAYPNGGFANFRTKQEQRSVFELPFLSMWTYSALAMRVKTDGRMYRFNLHSCDHSKEDVYQVEFTTRPGAWDTLVMPFPSFRLVSRGRVRHDQYEFDRSALDGMGVLLADQQEGPFKMEIQWIKAIKEYSASSARSVSDSPNAHWQIQAAHTPGVHTEQAASQRGSLTHMPQLPAMQALQPAQGGAQRAQGGASAAADTAVMGGATQQDLPQDEDSMYVLREEVGAMGVPSSKGGTTRQEVEQALDDAAAAGDRWVGPASAVDSAVHAGRDKHTLPGYSRPRKWPGGGAVSGWRTDGVLESSKTRLSTAQRKRAARANQDDVLGPGD